MYSPSYFITNKLLHYIVQFEKAQRDIVLMPLPAKTKHLVKIRAIIDDLYYISKLCGINFDYKYAQELFHGRVPKMLELPNLILVNFKNSIEFTSQLVKDNHVALSVPVFLHINKILANRWVDPWNAGRFRNQSEEVDIRYDKWHHVPDNDKIVYLQKQLAAIIEWVQEDKFLVHPLIKVGVVIYELLQLYPFAAANQLTILALVPLLYEVLEVPLLKYSSTIRHFHTYEDEYIEAVKASRESGDLTIWLEQFVRGVTMDAQLSRDELAQMERESVRHKKKILFGLNSRQLNILRHLKKYAQISRSEYRKLMGVSSMTAYRDLQELVKRGLIFQYGHGRSTFYTLYKKEDENKESAVDAVDSRFEDVGVIRSDSIAEY